MTVRTFGKAAIALLALVAVWCLYLLIHQWNEQTIAGYEVRQNAITGVVQIRVGGDWKKPFTVDPYASAVDPAQLARVRFVDLAWGRNGILCARALVAPGPPIRGRLVLNINIIDTAWHKRIRERDLRANVDWPAGALTPFVLRTNLSSPSQANQKTILTAQPALSSGDDLSDGLPSK